MVKYYREADRLRNKRKNEMAWLQGMYVYEALCDAAPLMNGFAAKGTKARPYTSEPYAVTKRDLIERKRKKEREAYERKRAVMTAFSVAFNRRRKESNAEEVQDD